MQVARAAGAGTDRQLTGHLRLAGRGECRHFLMAHMHPFDRAPAAQRLGKAIQTVAHDAEDPLNASLLQRRHEKISYVIDCHRISVSCRLSALCGRGATAYCGPHDAAIPRVVRSPATSVMAGQFQGLVREAQKCSLASG